MLNIYNNRKIFITGHTGFVGSWLSLWLTKLGAEVYGYSDKISLTPNTKLFNRNIKTEISNIQDIDKLRRAVQEYKPDLIFHLAAQPLVRQSYKNPINTFKTNTIGTLNILEASQNIENLKGAILITTDKVYSNINNIKKKYNEDDVLGGTDPYSCSKSCAEEIIHCYRESFYKKTNIKLISVRAGNILGGGDYGQDRLVPDIIRQTVKNERVIIRNPFSIRPWSYVGDIVNGYLQIGKAILEDNKKIVVEHAFNFSLEEDKPTMVLEILTKCKMYWNKIDFEVQQNSSNPHEENYLSLSNGKSRYVLRWIPKYNTEEMLKETIRWYREYHENKKIITLEQIDNYEKEIY